MADTTSGTQGCPPLRLRSGAELQDRLGEADIACRNPFGVLRDLLQAPDLDPHRGGSYAA